MTPHFTIHAGEYLVGSFIEEKLDNLNVWVPANDTGIDLLVTNKRNTRCVSLQVKYSKDYVPTHTTGQMQHNLKAIGWWSLTRTKIEESKADLWVFVIPSFFHPERQFILMTPKELLDLLNRVHGSDAAKIQSYFSVTTKNRCFESRGLNKDDEESMAMHRYENQARDCTKYLNNWNALIDRMKEKAEPSP